MKELKSYTSIWDRKVSSPYEGPYRPHNETFWGSILEVLFAIVLGLIFAQLLFWWLSK